MPTAAQASIAFDWTNTVHSREKSVHGQAHLDKNRKKFGGQNRRIVEYLMEAGELDNSIVREWNPPIWYLNSRISDIKNVLGFLVHNKRHESKNLTVYFMDAKQKEYNKILMQKLKG